MALCWTQSLFQIVVLSCEMVEKMFARHICHDRREPPPSVAIWSRAGTFHGRLQVQWSEHCLFWNRCLRLFSPTYVTQRGHSIRHWASTELWRVANIDSSILTRGPLASVVGKPIFRVTIWSIFGPNARQATGLRKKSIRSAHTLEMHLLSFCYSTAIDADLARGQLTKIIGSNATNLDLTGTHIPIWFLKIMALRLLVLSNLFWMPEDLASA